MGKVDLPYVQAFRDRHGKRRYYYRRWGKQYPLKGEPGSAEFMADYDRLNAAPAVPEKAKAKRGTFGALVETYYAAPEFTTDIRESTRTEYKRHIEPMREKWADIPIEGITKRVVRAYRDSLADKPPKANSALAVLTTLLNYAVETEMIETNPASSVKGIKHKTEGWKPWPLPALQRFARDAKDPARIAFCLALFTGQRRADVLAMRWDAITQDGCIIVKQEKKGEDADPLTIPIHPRLQIELERVRREQDETRTRRAEKGQAAAAAMTIVAKRNGQPYTDDGFATIWHRAQKEIGCDGLPFHGLRKNAVNALFEAGCTVKQVQAITGHTTLEMVERYGKKAEQKRLARSAMALLMARNETET